jgi:hypothetical protein
MSELINYDDKTWRADSPKSFFDHSPSTVNGETLSGDELMLIREIMHGDELVLIRGVPGDDSRGVRTAILLFLTKQNCRSNRAIQITQSRGWVA